MCSKSDFNINWAKKRLLLPMLIFFGTNATVFAQDDKTPALKQSVFYDAQALYYALKNIRAFPIYLRSEQVSQTTTVNQLDSSDPGPGGRTIDGNTGPNAVVITSRSSNSQTVSSRTVKHYKIVNSITGDILVADCIDDELDNTIKKFKITESEKTALISSLLCHNAGIPLLSDYANIKREFSSNYYFNAIFDSEKFKELQSGGGSAVTSLSGSVPSMNTLAEGLAGFYIDRVNEEINDAFFIHLQEALSKYPELRILFPNTLTSLDKIKVTSYQQSLNVIKAAYQADLKELLHNISGLATLQKYQQLVNNHPPLTLLFATCNLLDMLQQKKSPADILYTLGTAPYVQLPLIKNKNTNDYASVIGLAAAISNAFININLSDPRAISYQWVSNEAISSIINNKEQYKLFMGLLCLNIKHIHIGNINIYKTLTDSTVASKICAVPTVANNFVNLINTLKSTILTLNSANGVSSKTALYIDMAVEFTGTAKYLINLLPVEARTTATSRIEAINNYYIPLLYQTNRVVEQLENKAYSAAIFQADTLVIQIQEAVTSAISESKGSIRDSLKNLQTVLQEAHECYLKYGPFIAAVAEAQNANDVKNAISAFALPVGSSRLKKEHRFSWGLNSYVGLYYSWNSNHTGNNLPRNERGITAPLGIAANWKLPNRLGSISAYGGIIDIGAIFSYKVNTDNSVQSQIEFGQLLSPSLGLVYGLFMAKKYNIPISIGYNYQWGPRLKNIDKSGNSVLSALTTRHNLFIAIDIPLLNFHVSND